MIDSVFDRPVVRPKTQSYFFLVTPSLLSVTNPERTSNNSYRLRVMKGTSLLIIRQSAVRRNAQRQSS